MTLDPLKQEQDSGNFFVLYQMSVRIRKTLLLIYREESSNLQSAMCLNSFFLFEFITSKQTVQTGCYGTLNKSLNYNVSSLVSLSNLNVLNIPQECHYVIPVNKAQGQPHF